VVSRLDLDDVKFCTIVYLAFTGLLVSILFSLTFIEAVTYHQQRYEVTITVQAVEYSSRFGDHTNVWARVYGEQDITYRFIGRVELELGKTYHVVFVDQMWFTPFGFEVRGNVVSVEEVSEV